jgi:hypothetical protein
MKRVILLLTALIGAAAGAYAQDTLKTEDPASNDVVQVGILYLGSVCSGEEQPGYADFYFRVTRELKDGWVEAEFARYLTTEYARATFKPLAKTMRLNLRQMCSLQTAEPLK